MIRLVLNARGTLLAAIGAATLLLGGALASHAGAAPGNGNGEGHTPVTLCHWVPAHGGSYVLITVDDDGSSGNANLQGHAAHENDVLAVDGACPVEEPDDDGDLD